MSTVEMGLDGQMKWERVDPPLWWPAANTYIVGDRHLPDGVRQHMVKGSVAAGTVVSNAQVIGQADVPQAEFSDRQSHLKEESHA